MRRTTILAVAAVLLTSCASPDLEKGKAARAAGDWETALENLRPLAEEGSAEAQFLLGEMHAEGQGVPASVHEAVNWYRQAGDQGHTGAQVQLGLSYERGYGGLKKDLSEAASWYRRAAQQGDPEAQFSLGHLYDNGEGVEEDKAAAAEWYRKAAEQGHALAQSYLAILYEYGEGVPQSLVLAYMWYDLAASAKNAPPSAARSRDEVARRMESDDVREAQRLAAERAGK